MPVRRALVALLLLVPLLVPARAGAVVESFQIQTFAPNRIWNQVSWIPFAVEPQPGHVRRLRHGGHSWRGIWTPVAIGGGSTAQELAAARKFPGSSTAVIADTRLSASIRRRFAPVAELYRDADVLVVAAGHPACAGISRAQARAVVRGGVTRWDEVVPGAPGAIRVRYPSAGGADLAESHFGVGRPLRRFAKLRYAPGAKGARDGGVGAAAAGDASIAAITTWSRSHGGPPGTCAVPLDGVAPSDASVGSLAYPEAFPVTYLRLRKHSTPFALAKFDAMAALFKTEAFRAQLRGYGVVLPA